MKMARVVNFLISEGDDNEEAVARLRAVGFEVSKTGRVFTRRSAFGAIRNGAKVIKVTTEEGDTHILGSCATIIGSVHESALGYGYFVQWDGDDADNIMFIVGKKIAELS
jgi:hypothetical protein